jgi:hypothetical protein
MDASELRVNMARDHRSDKAKIRIDADVGLLGIGPANISTLTMTGTTQASLDSFVRFDGAIVKIG